MLLTLSLAPLLFIVKPIHACYCSVYYIYYTRVLLKSYDSLYFTDTRSNLDQLHTLDTAQIQKLSTVALQLLIFIYFFSQLQFIVIQSLCTSISVYLIVHLLSSLTLCVLFIIEFNRSHKI